MFAHSQSIPPFPIRHPTTPTLTLARRPYREPVSTPTEPMRLASHSAVEVERFARQMEMAFAEREPDRRLSCPFAVQLLRAQTLCAQLSLSVVASHAFVDDRYGDVRLRCSSFSMAQTLQFFDSFRFRFVLSIPRTALQCNALPQFTAPTPFRTFLVTAAVVFPVRSILMSR